MKALLITLAVLLIGTVAEAKSFEELIMSPDHSVQLFEIYAPETSHYELDVRLCPAMHPDSSLTEYLFAVEGGGSFTLRPSEDGWQEFIYKDNGGVILHQGVNRLAVATKHPEYPDVTSVSILSNTIIKSDSLRNNSNESEADGEMNELVAKIMSSPRQSPVVNTSVLPLKYSFWTRQTWSKGDTIKVISEADSPYHVDIMFYGTEKKFVSPGIGVIPNGATQISYTEGLELQDLIPVRPPRPAKPLELVEYASRSERHFLNWQFRSEPDSSGKESIRRSLIVPQSGIYIIKLRGKNKSSSGIANILVGNGYYRNADFSYSGTDFGFNADGKTWTLLTVTNDNYLDPILYVEGNDAERVVEYNDDRAGAASELYGAGRWDSYIETPYSIRTTGYHVSSYDVSCDEGDCIVYAIDTEVLNSILGYADPVSLRSRDSGVASLTDLACGNPVIRTQRGIIEVISPEEIESVYIFDLSGYMVCHASGLETHIFKSDTLATGIYLVSVNNSWKGKVAVY